MDSDSTKLNKKIDRLNSAYESSVKGVLPPRLELLKEAREFGQQTGLNMEQVLYLALRKFLKSRIPADAIVPGIRSCISNGMTG